MQVTKHIRVRSAGSTGESAADLAAFTPSFLWLLRDFYLGAALPTQQSHMSVGCQGCVPVRDGRAATAEGSILQCGNAHICLSWLHACFVPAYALG